MVLVECLVFEGVWWLRASERKELLVSVGGGACDLPRGSTRAKGRERQELGEVQRACMQIERGREKEERRGRNRERREKRPRPKESKTREGVVDRASSRWG